MSLTQEKIASLKKLTALHQGENFSIESVLDSFASLRVLKIPPDSIVSRSGNRALRLRPDMVEPSSTASDELLSCSPQRVVAHQISLGSIMHGE